LGGRGGLYDALAALTGSLTKARVDGEARHTYEIAIGPKRDPAVRRFLERRQSALRD
jgi:predicted RNA polymerase sigma factor